MYIQSTCLSLLFSVPYRKSQNVYISLIAAVPKKVGDSSKRALAGTDKSKLESYLRNMGWALQMIMIPNKTYHVILKSFEDLNYLK